MKKQAPFSHAAANQETFSRHAKLRGNACANEFDYRTARGLEKSNLRRDVLPKKPPFGVLQTLWNTQFIHAPKRSWSDKSVAANGQWKS